MKMPVCINGNDHCISGRNDCIIGKITICDECQQCRHRRCLLVNKQPPGRITLSAKIIFVAVAADWPPPQQVLLAIHIVGACQISVTIVHGSTSRSYLNFIVPPSQ